MAERLANFFGMLLGCAVLSALVAGGLAYGVTRMWKPDPVAQWPTTTGIVEEIGVDRTGPVGDELFRPRVRYRYEVDGRNYENTRVYYRDLDYQTEEEAGRVAALFEKGQVVDVSYDPGDPERSFLDRGAHASPVYQAEFRWTFLILLGAFFLPGALYMWSLSGKDPEEL